MIMQPYPNRWHTPVTVEVHSENQDSVFKTFSDLQLAYIWIMSHVEPYTINQWYINSFEETCTGLDISYDKRGLRGYYCVMQHRGGITKDFIVYYGILSI